jgi:inorganic pyrophosphatase
MFSTATCIRLSRVPVPHCIFPRFFTSCPNLANIFTSSHNINVKTSYLIRTEQITRHISGSSIQPKVELDAKMASRYSVRKIGAPNTLEHRIYIEKDGIPCSPFHDIPLFANEQRTVLNMIVEIPRWTNAKLEVSSQLTKRSC